jgi:hypothetical protein
VLLDPLRVDPLDYVVFKKSFLNLDTLANFYLRVGLKPTVYWLPPMLSPPMFVPAKLAIGTPGLANN